MPALFNHTIIASLDRAASAEFYRSILEAEEAPSWGPFTNLSLAGGVMLQFAEPPVEIQMQHYAFLVDDQHFDRAYERLVSAGVTRRPWRLFQRPRRARAGADHQAVLLNGEGGRWIGGAAWWASKIKNFFNPDPSTPPHPPNSW
jgi:catechol 2,3-dioxygenase-like lactoylglutathione lyase family enzyme